MDVRVADNKGVIFMGVDERCVGIAVVAEEERLQAKVDPYFFPGRKSNKVDSINKH